MQHEGEPSVEEILASIKKVIARDNREEAAELRRKRNEDRVSRSEEVLELDEAAALADDGEDADSDGPLIRKESLNSMQSSLEALAMLAEPGARPQIVRSGETSLEGLVREMLRPMLATWLDDNLPPMVERLVAAEIARIAGKRG
ncbi:MAG: DUF2497 domain-containing protein [Novosphingobium sp.]|nr:DUF2497 domain-containing protein [Novosphingobium sp.]